MSDYFQPAPSPEGRHVTVAVIAVLLSLVLHFLLYQTFGSRSFALLDLLAPTQREVSPKQESALRAELMPPAPPVRPSRDPLRSGEEGLETTGVDERMIHRLSSPTAASIFEPPPVMTEAPATPELDQLAPPPEADLPVWTPRQEILSLLDATVRDVRAPIPRREIPLIERQQLAPDITASYDLLEGLARASESMDGVSRIAAPLSVSLEPALLPLGGDEAFPEPKLGPEAEGDTATSLIAEIPAAVAPGHPLDDRLRIAVETYVPSRRADDGHLYFRIDVHRKDDEALPGLPRDIVFVQDTSGSLGERYLHPCRVAIREAIEALRPQDRFNIIQFSHEIDRCFPDWVSPDAGNLAQAEEFLNAMRSDGWTDLFGSVSEILSLSREPGRPVIAVLITDGHATTGQLERDSQIIGTFTRINAGAVSVFSVGVHPRANRFLLDMLSYNNRGGSSEIAPDRFTVLRTIQRLNNSILRPLLGDVRFNFDVVSGAEVYPKLTTNLYEDRPLQLFGRVRAENPVVAFQARGSAGEDRYDMLFEVDLLGPESSSGDRDLVQQWATQRMYELVARFARSEDPAIIAEMHRLGTEFRIPVPYASRLP